MCKKTKLNNFLLCIFSFISPSFEHKEIVFYNFTDSVSYSYIFYYLHYNGTKKIVNDNELKMKENFTTVVCQLLKH